MVYPALLPLMRTPRLPVIDWTDAPPPIYMDSSVSPKDDIWFLRVCHHISNTVYLNQSWIVYEENQDLGLSGVTIVSFYCGLVYVKKVLLIGAIRYGVGVASNVGTVRRRGGLECRYSHTTKGNRNRVVFLNLWFAKQVMNLTYCCLTLLWYFFFLHSYSATWY